MVRRRFSMTNGPFGFSDPYGSVLTRNDDLRLLSLLLCSVFWCTCARIRRRGQFTRPRWTEPIRPSSPKRIAARRPIPSWSTPTKRWSIGRTSKTTPSDGSTSTETYAKRLRRRHCTDSSWTWWVRADAEREYRNVKRASSCSRTRITTCSTLRRTTSWSSCCSFRKKAHAPNAEHRDEIKKKKKKKLFSDPRDWKTKPNQILN